VKLSLGHLLLAVVAGACFASFGHDARAQAPESWNGGRVQELVDQAQAVRSSVAVDSAFQSYRGEARGYVYFFIDRPDSDERTLVKADQVALDLFWRAPNETRQRIVGLRDEKVLPTNIRYHLDHLTVVQDDFGDFIRLGDGDEVEEVHHPIGPAGRSHYDYLLADSLSISYGSGPEEIRVYEVSVRPKNYEAPGFIGSIYIDRDTGAIVRMNFTFTPSSYVDPYLDYIRISLDNSLWDGRYWLPYRQEAELRRELPVLDFLAGSIIRGRFEIGQYEFNAEIPRQVWLARGVSAASEEERRAFSFTRGLFDDLEAEGLSSSTTIEDIRAQASQVIGQRYLSGLSPLRLHLGAASDALRHNRAEGAYFGGGLTLRPGGDVLLRTSLGYAHGRGEGAASISASGGPGRITPKVRAYWNDVRDMGQTQGASRLVSSLGSSFGIQDYTDPYFAQGMSLSFSSGDASAPAVTLLMERHESAEDVVSEVPGVDARRVKRIDDGVLVALNVMRAIEIPGAGQLTANAKLGRLGEHTFGTLLGEAKWRGVSMQEGRRIDLSVVAGVTSEGTPQQGLFLLGGRGTLPGHSYRDFAGTRFWLASSEVNLPLRWPLLSFRAFAAAGGTYFGERVLVDLLPDRWPGSGRGGLRGSVGIGVALGWDVIRLDMARGVGAGGGWEFIFSVAPQFRDWL
jgi:hypothetical protein